MHSKFSLVFKVIRSAVEVCLVSYIIIDKVVNAIAAIVQADVAFVRNKMVEINVRIR